MCTAVPRAPSAVHTNENLSSFRALFHLFPLLHGDHFPIWEYGFLIWAKALLPSSQHHTYYPHPADMFCTAGNNTFNSTLLWKSKLFRQGIDWKYVQIQREMYQFSSLKPQLPTTKTFFWTTYVSKKMWGTENSSIL